MNEAILRPMHSITPIFCHDDSADFKVLVRIPLEYGWNEKVRLNVVKNGSFDLCYEPYEIPHHHNDDEGYSNFETTINLATSALYYYYFSYECNGHYMLIKKGDENNTSISKKECFKLSVNFSTPDWAKGAIMYQIMVDRFFPGTVRSKIPYIRGRTINSWEDPPVIGPNVEGDWNVDFYGGTLSGVTEKLDYIQDLGATVIYLNPIQYGQSNHLYDTVDYEMIDPYLGTEDDLKTLCTEAHKRGMHIIIDGVYNHTGNRSKYFDQYSEHSEFGAFNNPNSPYATFYKKKWHNGQLSYSYWWDQPSLPECDTNNPIWQDYITGKDRIVDWLFRCGIDGIRLDVADELSDRMIEKILEAITRNKPDGFLFGEVWEDPMIKEIKDQRRYISSGKGMHSVMNYSFQDALIRYYKYQDFGKLDCVANSILTNYPKDMVLTLMNFTSTHDISRLIEIFACNFFNSNGQWAWDLYYGNASDFVKSHKLTQEEYEYGKKILKSYIVATAFFPGIFSIFYGDEVGTQGLHNLANRRSYPWGNEDLELLEYFKQMLKVRNSQKFLKYADCKICEISKAHFVFERFLGDEKILVIASRTHYETETNIPTGYNVSEILFKSSPNNNLEKLDPYGALILRVTT